MKVVLDTNVLVSAVFFSGTPARVLEAWSSGRFVLLATAEIASEYQRVLARLQGRYPTVEVEPLLTIILRECSLVEPIAVPNSACDDPGDVKFLACALAGRARCIVSGDRALLRASGFGGVEVLAPATFVRRYL